ncbi:ABC transporter permease [Acidaminobacter sp. JC074]|uniref:ABC transporter permease n=1 Tax=Acidaminobacter sp. JC074 TaxID=2530199 RepID=UPI001F0E8B5F|nr:ABC transporter permease [Acidaminobacter sp. JC074]MCH4887054.1 ABC transporter permease [Acidaminobacter sp. JC074]
MSRYIVGRLFQMIPVILGVTFVVFVILSLSPGDPAQMILGQQAEKEEIELMREQLGLNDPIVIRYVKYVGRVLQGDLGTSYSTKEQVSDMILQRLPVTLLLSFTSLFVTLLCAIPLGILLAVKQNTMFDDVMRILSLVIAAMPSFWLGLMLIILFSVKLGWLPANGMETPLAIIMPVICMSAAGIAVNSRLTRASMLDVIRQDYIRTARAKGVSEKTILRKHALKNALLPMVTSIGMAIAGSFGGSVLIETVFGINGLGKLIVNQIRQKDVPTIMASVLITAIIIAVMNLLTDLTYGVIDPRIKSQFVKKRKAVKVGA